MWFTPPAVAYTKDGPSHQERLRAATSDVRSGRFFASQLVRPYTLRTRYTVDLNVFNPDCLIRSLYWCGVARSPFQWSCVVARHSAMGRWWWMLEYRILVAKR